MQPGAKASLLGAIKITLAAWLSLLLLTSGFASVSPDFHSKLHSTNGSAGHFCLVCSISKGSVSAADPVPFLTGLVASVIFLAAILPQALLRGIDLRLAHSRGPPSHRSSKPVAG